MSNELSFVFTKTGDHLKKTTSSTLSQASGIKKTKDNSGTTTTHSNVIDPDEFNCGVCLDTIYNCVTLMPCLHNLCGSCCTAWFKRKQECPLCKADVTMAKKDARINSLINQYCPRKLAADEKKALDDTDYFFKNQQMDIKKPKPPKISSRGRRIISTGLFDAMGGSDDSDFDPGATRTSDRDVRNARRRTQNPNITRARSPTADDGQNADSDGGAPNNDGVNGSSSNITVGGNVPVRRAIRPFTPVCVECTARRAVDGDRHRCNADTQHIQCESCKNMMPDRTSTHEQRCNICAKSFCFLYFHSSCEGRITLRKLKDHPVNARFADATFRGNKFEQQVRKMEIFFLTNQVLEDFLAARGFTPRTIFEHCMNTYVHPRNFDFVEDRTFFKDAFRKCSKFSLSLKKINNYQLR